MPLNFVTPLWLFAIPGALDLLAFKEQSTRSLFRTPSTLGSSPSLGLPLVSELELFGEDGTEEEDWKLFSEPSLWQEAGLEAELEELI